ncbi:MAG TPA: cobalamin-binding protein [Clostridia bacterium]|nr:cobalamin-binding protein [Clostridia bacterium]
MIDLQALAQALGDLDEDRIMAMVQEFLAGNPSPEDAQQVITACQEGMSKVGDLFEQGEYYVADLIYAGDLLTRITGMLKPVLGGSDTRKIGKIVLGTVEGDLHDIGKNIFRNMAEAAGFEVYDLGIDQKPSAFVEKVKEVHPQIVGMSGVLTLALDSMEKTVQALAEAGLRDAVKVIIGGNPVTESACKKIGADAFTTSAAEGVRICKNWVS